MTCALCRLPARKLRRTWCQTCYERWRYHGCPEPGPPYGQAAGRRSDVKVSRMEDLALIWSPGMTDREAARRIGVCHRTVQRYRAEMRLAA